MSSSYDENFDYDEYYYDDTYDHLYETNKATRRRSQKTNNWKFKTPTTSKKKISGTKIFTINGSPADIKAREQAKIIKRAREHKGTIELKHHLYDPYIIAYYENLEIDTETHPDYGYRPLCFNRQKLHFELVRERLTYYNTYYNYNFGENKYYYAVTDHYFSTHSPSLIKGTWRSIHPTECGKIQQVNLMNPKAKRQKRAFWEMDEIDLNDPPYKLTKTFKTALLKPPLN
jgi:hypothetical protein